MIKKVLIIAAVLAAACFFPQLVFYMQDSYRMESTQTGKREGIDIETLNISYEMSLNKRLESFAAGVDKCFAASTDAKISSESYELFEELLSQDIVRISEGYGLLFYYSGYDIMEQKKYVIYNEEEADGVMLMAWYFNAEFSNGCEVKLLADEKTGTIYYISFQKDIEAQKRLNDEEKAMLSFLNNVYYAGIDLLYFFADYYEPDYWEELLEEENAYQQQNFSETDRAESKQDCYEVKLFYENAFWAGNEFLTLFLRAEQNETGFPNLALGIREIAELIPELSKN